MAYLSFRSPPRPKSLRRKESRVFDASEEDRYRRVFPPGGARRWPKVGVSWKDRPDDALVAISNNVGSSGWLRIATNTTNEHNNLVVGL
jgi:hypothetical protein